MCPSGPEGGEVAEIPVAPNSLGDIVERIERAAGDGVITVGELLASLGPASFSAVMLVPALAVVTPLSGIPLFSSFCGIMIAIIAAQMLSGRHHLWLPRFVTIRRLNGRRVRRAMASVKRPVAWLDRVTAPRFDILLHPPLVAIPQILCLLCGLAMPFLEFLPFTSSILGMAVVLMSMAMLVRDGLFAIAGVLAISGAIWAMVELTSLVV